jgi:hypothetical protein
MLSYLSDEVLFFALKFEYKLILPISQNNLAYHLMKAELKSKNLKY